ncbi:hypothetical protein KEM56_000031 [Ascosphaera pollenicola]|nr:hypothetical protein KEM56_000031 [Ascosphaera pollenicola]
MDEEDLNIVLAIEGLDEIYNQILEQGAITLALIAAAAEVAEDSERSGNQERLSVVQQIIGGGHYGAWMTSLMINVAAVKPDGLCSSLAGPMKGSMADWLMYEKSGLDNEIGDLFDEMGLAINDRPLFYGGTAYTSRRAITGPWRRPARGQLSEEKKRFNQRLSNKRVAVENFFAIV